jgi:hypothetical protein
MNIKSGQTYIFQVNLNLPDGFTIEAGETIILLEPTGQKPHGLFDNETGHNWLCKASNGVTVWSTIPLAVKEGFLVLDESGAKQC